MAKKTLVVNQHEYSLHRWAKMADVSLSCLKNRLKGDMTPQKAVLLPHAYSQYDMDALDALSPEELSQKIDDLVNYKPLTRAQLIERHKQFKLDNQDKKGR